MMTRHFCSLIVGLATLLTAIAPATAIVVSTTKSTVEAPPDDPGWSNIGTRSNATAIYLGNRWVLTANHLRSGRVTLTSGQTYDHVPGTAYQITNSANPSIGDPADLLLFQIDEDPGLPPVEIVRSTPDVGTEVVVIGNGLDYDPSQIYWDVTQRGATWVWDETSPPGEYSGFKSNGPGLLRWGTNLIEDEETFGREFDDDITTVLNQTTTETVTFLTEFDMDGSQADDNVIATDGSTATRFESQAILSDSGGSLFIKDGDDWKLAGTVLAVEGHRNQPDVTRTAIFGAVTHYADLATYLPEIESRYVFGDFDADVTLDVDDLDLLAQAINQDDYDARFDLNRDGSVDSADRVKWVEDVKMTYFGDANLDGVYSTDDLVVVLQSGQYEDDVPGNSTWATGDWNGDLEFDSGDFVLALQSGGFEAGPRVSAASQPAIAAVPEPSSYLLVSSLLLLPLMRRM